MGLWKTKFQEQVESSTAPNGHAITGGGGGDSSEKLDKALQDAAQAQEEALMWKEKASVAEDLKGKMPTCPRMCVCFSSVRMLYGCVRVL